MEYSIILGYLAATCTTLAFIPQVIRTIKTHSTKDISLAMYLIFSFGILFWFIYGILLDQLPIILANGITFVLAVIVLIQKIRHG